MKKNIIPIIIFIVFLFLFVSGCGGDSNKNNSNGGNSNRMIIEKNDYNSIKDNWFADDFINNKAKEKAVTNLVKGETYFFVYSFELTEKYFDGSVNGSLLSSYLSFSLKTWGDIYYDNDAVNIKNYETSKQCLYKNEDGFMTSDVSFEMSSCKLVVKRRSEIKDYIAIEFSPKYTGSLNIESLVYGEEYAKAEDRTHYITATVLNSKNELNNASIYSVSNVSYGLVSEDLYMSGDLNPNTNLEDISEMKIGKNYVVVDYDIEVEEEKSLDSLIYCGIYMHNGSISSAELEEVNTSKTNSSLKDDGYIYDFSYKCPTDNVKRVRTVLSFEVMSSCLIDLELYFYSDNAIINGINYSADYFQNEDISTLKFEFDEKTQVLAVSGFDEIKEETIIPMKHKGMRVLKIADDAFANNQTITNVKIGDYVEVIGKNAFASCSNLSNIEIGKNVAKIYSMAFSYLHSINKLKIPKSVSFIANNAFYGNQLISRFNSPVQFEEFYGWYISYYSVDVSSAPEIEKYLFKNNDTYGNLERYTTLDIRDLNLNMSNAEYDSSVDGYELIKGKHYTFTISFDAHLLTKNINNPIAEFGFSFTKTGISDMKMTVNGATKVNYYDNSDYCYSWIELSEMEQYDDAHIEIVIDFTRESGGKKMSGVFSNSSYTKGAKGEDFTIMFSTNY